MAVRLTPHLLLFEGLIEPSISGDSSGRLSYVRLDSGDYLSQSLHISDVVLIFHMRKDQAIVIFRQGNDGAELTVGMTLSLLDDSDIQLMQRIDPVLGNLAGKNLSCLIDDSLPERDQTIKLSSGFRKSSTVRYAGGLIDHMAGHLFEFFDRLFPVFWVSHIDGLLIGTIIPMFQQMDTDHHANGFPLTAQRAVVGA